MILTFLHVSDLHFDSTKEFDRSIVIKALLEDIRSARANGTTFDAAIFSGDLVQAGESKDSFSKVVAAFIDPLLVAANLTRDELVLCPGNHDANRKSIAAYVEEGLRQQFYSIENINKFIDDALGDGAKSHATMAALERMENFESFYKSLGLSGHKSDNVFFKTRVLDIGGVRVGVAALNSAWRATGGNNDKNALIIGERAVDLAISDLEECDFRICVAHHPLDWLLECDSTAIENRLFDRFDLLCFGHTHRARPHSITSPMSSALISMAGTIYENRKHFNGYQIIKWDGAASKVNIACRMYLDQRRAFVPAEVVSPNGLAEFYIKTRPGGQPLSEIEIFLRRARPAIREAADKHISFASSERDRKKEEFAEAFICPPLTKHLDASAIMSGERSIEVGNEEVSCDDLLRWSEDIVLVGQSECGRTSLLHHMSVRTSEGVCDRIRVPVIVSTPLAVRSGYDKAVRGYYENADYKTSEISSAMKALPWIVYLDDFNESDQTHLDLLGAAKSAFQHHRFVIVTSAGHKSIREVLGKVSVIHIGLLPRKSIRHLSRVRFSGDLQTGLDDPAYVFVMRHIDEARLPRTGYMVSLLLWAAEQNKLGETLNEAVLIENLVSYLLGKTNFEAAFRNQFDPRAQELLLRAIAKELRASGGWTRSNDLLKFVIGYFESRGLTYGAREVIEELIACRLLIEQEGYIAFSYSCYQEYFVALDLRHDSRWLADLLQTASLDTLIDYGRELDLCSSLMRETHGVDGALLRGLKEAGLDAEGEQRDLGSVQFVGHELRLKPKRVKEILENPPSKDQIDEIMDKLDPAQDRQRKRLRRDPDQKSSEELESHSSSSNHVRDHAERLDRQTQGLTILAKVIRNCDHDKLDHKEKSIVAILKLWSAYVLEFIEFMSEVFAFVETEIENGKLKGVELTSDDLRKLENVLKYLIPYLESHELGEILPSVSLRKPLRNAATTKSNPEGIRFFAAFCYAETWDKAGIDLVAEVMKDIKNRVLGPVTK